MGLSLALIFVFLLTGVYGLGHFWQPPIVEAARPLVYATALVLVGLILVLNLTAIAVRNRLREKYKSESD